MVDDMKKQMCRFENLIGFEGKLTVTSRKSMQELIDALSSKYKKDVQSSLRLHRLEFFYDLVESQRRKREKREEDIISDQRAKQKSSRKKVKEEGEKPTDEDQQTQLEEKIKPKIADEIVQIKAEDIDDWKDLMTLSRIYYVMEHPRSVGLAWKRRITKKKKIDKFEDRDLIEWRVSQNFRLRGLEEWAQRRSDAHRLAELSSYYSEDSDDSEEDNRGMDDLFQMFDPSGRRKCKKVRKVEGKKPPSVRPFKLCDESIEDWTESYSEDSEPSGTEDFLEETEDFSDEADIKVFDAEEDVSLAFEEEDISELLAVYPEFSTHREPIFKEMDEAKTFEDWFGLYKKATSQFEELKAKEQAVTFEVPDVMQAVTEEEEEKLDEHLEKEEVAEEKSDEHLEKGEAEEKSDEHLEKEEEAEEILDETPEHSEEFNETEGTVKPSAENQEIGETELKESTSSENQEIEKEDIENGEEKDVSLSPDEADETDK